MRKLLFLLAIVLFNSISFAQDCNSFYNFKEGTSFTLQNFNAKNKLVASTKQKCLSLSQSSNTFSMTMQSEMYDEKNKKLSEGTFILRCENGVIKFDMKNLAMRDMPDMKNTDMKVEVTGDELDLPSNLEVGQALNNVTYGVKATMGAMNLFNRQISIKDRKVEAKESVTTPAGTFDCYKVSYITETTGLLGKKVNIKSVIWYAKNYGMVKEESYDEKGKLMGYTLLSEFK
jgi:hypothetical protein